MRTASLLIFALIIALSFEGEFVKYQEEKEIAFLTISNQDNSNSLNLLILDELEKCLNSIDILKIKAIIITGEGEKSFVTDLDESSERFSKTENNLFNKIQSFPIPVIAAINGVSMGGGFELALSCDIRICSDNAIFIQSEKGEKTLSFIGTKRLSKLIGTGKAKKILLTNERINAEEALKIGLVTDVFPQKELLNEAKKLAENIAKNEGACKLKNFMQEGKRFKKGEHFFNFKELMEERYSCRLFKKKEIPESILKEIIKTSEMTPSWENSQPWNIYIAVGDVLEEVRKVWIEKGLENMKGYADMDPGHRTYFSERAQKSMEIQNEAIRKFTNDDSKLTRIFTLNNELFNAPAMVYITLKKGYTNWSVYDVGALGNSIMLSAKSYGIDSIPAYQVVKFPDVIRKFLNIPEEEDIIIGIALGYEEDDIVNKFRSARLPLEEVCHIRKNLP